VCALEPIPDPRQGITRDPDVHRVHHRGAGGEAVGYDRFEIGVLHMVLIPIDARGRKGEFLIRRRARVRTRTGRVTRRPGAAVRSQTGWVACTRLLSACSVPGLIDAPDTNAAAQPQRMVQNRQASRGRRDGVRSG
jgi:hypothetical protein